MVFSKLNVISIIAGIAVIVVLCYIIYIVAVHIAFSPDKPTITELTRISSPDGVVDAVLIKKGTHSTVPVGYEVYLVPQGKSISNAFSEFLSDHTNALEIYWKQDKLLVISYKQARIFKFSNFWHSKEVQNFKYVVELQLEQKGKGFALGERDRGIDSLKEKN